MMFFPAHVSLGYLMGDEVVIECRAYDATCWITAGGRDSKEAFGKIVAYARILGVEPPVPTLTRLDSEAGRGAASWSAARYPVRVFAYLEETNPLVALVAHDTFGAFALDVGVFRDGPQLAFAMSFSGKLVRDDDVRHHAATFRRALEGSSCVPGTEWRDALFATYDTTPISQNKLDRRNEIILFL